MASSYWKEHPEYVDKVRELYAKGIRKSKVIARELNKEFNINCTPGSIHGVLYRYVKPVLDNGQSTLRREMKKDPKTCLDKDDSTIRETINTKGEKEIHLESESTEIHSVDELVEKYKIDMDKWELVDKTISRQTIYTNYRDQDLSWEDGKMTGFSVRKPELITKVVTHIKAKFRYKVEEVKLSKIISDQVDDMQKHSPKVYEDFNLILGDDGEYVYEVPLVDIHYGLLSWWEETGENYDIKIAEKLAIKSVEHQLARISHLDLHEIILPTGNDLFNVNTQDKTTARGTPQDEEGREPKIFRKCREMWVKIIDMCRQLGPVKVIVVLDNHAPDRMFHLGDALHCWYRSDDNVTVENRPMMRKYYHFGNNLIGFCHGDQEKKERLYSLMTNEMKEAWAQTQFHEWHTGHFHHQLVEDRQGILFRCLPTLVIPSRWTKMKGYINLRNVQCMLWHLKYGLVEQHNWYPIFSKLTQKA